MSKQKKGQSSSGRTFKLIHQSLIISDVNFRKQTIIVSWVIGRATGLELMNLLSPSGLYGADGPSPHQYRQAMASAPQLLLQTVSYSPGHGEWQPQCQLLVLGPHHLNLPPRHKEVSVITNQP